MHHFMTNDRIPTNMNCDSEACDRMFKSVVCRVERFEISRSRRLTVGYCALCVLTILALIPLINSIRESTIQSGFIGYVSLLISDSSYMFTHWKEFLLSTTSSLPFLGMTILLLALLIFVMSLRRTARFSAYSNCIKKRLIANT